MVITDDGKRVKLYNVHCYTGWERLRVHVGAEVRDEQAEGPLHGAGAAGDDPRGGY